MKLKLVTLVVLFLACGSLYSQQVYLTFAGIVNFTSNAPLEVIKATSDQLHGAIDPSGRSFAFTIENNSFKGFNSTLQQEHFYENYLEVQEYPVSTFKGKFIEAIDPGNEKEQLVRAKGILNIHGIEQERIIKGTIRASGDKLIIHADFSVPLKDHEIKVPGIVNQKIADVIEVSISAELSPKK